MGAFLVYYVVASIFAIPFLGFLLLRTRRDLSELRAELRARGVLAPLGHGADAALPAPRDARPPVLPPGADRDPDRR
jgi:hypothetical protein